MRSASIYLLLLIATICLSQSQFVRTIGGNGNDFGRSITQTFEGGYAITGWTGSYGSGTHNALLVRLKPSTELQWARVVSGAGDDFSYSIVQATDSGYVITGCTNSYGAGDYDYLLVKFSESGSLEWARVIGGTNGEYSLSVIQTSDNGYALTGWTDSFGPGMPGARNILVVKVDSSGVIEWSRALSLSDYDSGHQIIQTSDGGYAIVGSSGNLYPAEYDLSFVKIDSSGEIEWTRRIDGTERDRGYSVVQDCDSGFVVIGNSNSYSSSLDTDDILLLKISSSGELEWARTLGSTGYEMCERFISTIDSGFVAVGVTTGFGSSNFTLIVLKLNSIGEVEWSRIFGIDDNREWGFSVVQMPDSGYVVTGESDNLDTSSTRADLFLARMDSDGNCCMGTFVTLTETIVSPSVIIPYSSISSPILTESAIAPTIIGISPTVLEICTENIFERQAKPNVFELFTWPNPFNSAVTISVGAIHELPLQIEIFDINGRRVTELPRLAPLGTPSLAKGNSPLKRRVTPALASAGTATGCVFIWQPKASLGSGVYLVRAKFDNQTATKRVVYLK